MCSMSVLCPLCAQTSFTSIDALRNSLIKAANGPLACPICSDLFLGLDKLTIHLFSHTNLMTTHTTTMLTDVPKNSRETKNSTKSSKSPIRYNPVMNVEDVMTTKKIADENIILEKKTKRSKQIKTIMKEKETQLLEPTSSLSTVNHQQLTTSPSLLSSPNATTVSMPSLINVESTEPALLSTCDICELTFRTEQLRDMHFRLVHQNSPQSTIIPTTSSSPTIISTASKAADFKCHLCAKIFKMKGSLRVHLKVVHMVGINGGNNASKLGICDRIRYKENKIQQNIKSSSCTKLFPSLDMQQIVLPSQAVQQPLRTFTNSPSPTELQVGASAFASAPQIGLTNVEAKKFGAPLHLEDPNLLNSNVLLGFSTSNTGEVVNETINNKPSIDNPKIWECDVCSKSFTTKYFLKKHKRLHTGEMPYSCEICARTFTFQQSYHKHLLYHSDEKPHICAVCGRAFKELSTLHNHERIHSGEKPFNCEICGKCFRQRVSFLVHTRIHTGVMPYKCEQCEKNFRYKVSLRTHKCQIAPSSQLEATANSQELISSHNILEGANNDQHTENFIKAFLESTTLGSTVNGNEAENSPASLEIAAITESKCLEPEKFDIKSVEALLSKSIDDIVVESCNKMGIGSIENMMRNNPITNGVDLLNPSTTPHSCAVQNFSDGSSSPLQKFQNMRLQSPKSDVPISARDQSLQLPQYLFNNNFNGEQ